MNKQFRILIIDDELGPRESLRMLLKEDYEVKLASSGDEGLVLHQQQAADLVILDLKMPDKDGIKVLSELRSLDKEVPVIILTGYATLEAAKEAVHLGAVEFVTKPFDVEEMRNLVKNALEKRAGQLATANLTEKLTRMNKELTEKLVETEKLASLGLLSAEILHEINNPLTVIKGFTQLLLQDMQEQKEISTLCLDYLRTIEEEIQRCQNLVRNILDSSKNKSSWQPINPNDILVKVISFLRLSRMGRNTNFILSLSPQLPAVVGSPQQLHQAFLNLLLNSIQAVPPEVSPEITVVSCLENDSIVISITDNGCGISPEDLPHIFEPFFTKGKPQGTGLGLSLVKKVITNHSGQIDVKTNQHGGSTFTIHLPAENKPL
ncbi:MAG: response regulator [Candidatus Omnitrophica bacterium]|nr:response regulator [Candidatus Omnitrophota bacterium]